MVKRARSWLDGIPGWAKNLALLFFGIVLGASAVAIINPGDVRGRTLDQLGLGSTSIKPISTDAFLPKITIVKADANGSDVIVTTPKAIAQYAEHGGEKPPTPEEAEKAEEEEDIRSGDVTESPNKIVTPPALPKCAFHEYGDAALTPGVKAQIGQTVHFNEGGRVIIGTVAAIAYSQAPGGQKQDVKYGIEEHEGYVTEASITIVSGKPGNYTLGSNPILFKDKAANCPDSD